MYEMILARAEYTHAWLGALIACMRETIMLGTEVCQHEWTDPAELALVANKANITVDDVLDTVHKVVEARSAMQQIQDDATVVQKNIEKVEQ